jgi:phosphoribosylformylglycinamidine cyclo-ligase
MADKSHSGLTYAEAGLNLDAGDRMVGLIKPLMRATAGARADVGTGGLGGPFDLAG